MFICDDCRIKKFTNAASLTGSYGKCELCGTLSACNDIPSKHLHPRPAQPFIAQYNPPLPPPAELAKLAEERMPMKIKLRVDETYTTEGEVRDGRIWFPSFDCQILPGESPVEALCRVFGKVDVEVF